MTATINDLPDEIIARIIIPAVRKDADREKFNEWSEWSEWFDGEYPKENFFLKFLYKYGQGTN